METPTRTPAGTIGNSEPLTRVTETWTAAAPEMGGILVREESGSPESGQRIKELVKFSPGEPDPNLFQPPAGLEIVRKDNAQGLCPVSPNAEAAPAAESEPHP